MENKPEPLPWQKLADEGWLIAGMNHYRVEGVRHLFCSMTKEGLTITAEGADDAKVFQDLEAKAESTGFARFHVKFFSTLDWAWTEADVVALSEDQVRAWVESETPRRYRTKPYNGTPNEDSLVITRTETSPPYVLSTNER